MTKPIAEPGGTLLGRLSPDALQLHLCAALVSADTDRPGFVSDAFLAAVAEDITLAVLELELTGRWVRQSDGYQVPAPELRSIVATLQYMLRMR